MVPLWISSRPNLSAAARPAQNRPGSDPSLVEEDIDLALQCRAAIGTALLGELTINLLDRPVIVKTGRRRQGYRA